MGAPFIVLDVEGYSTCKPYNIGWIVGNKKGEIFVERNFACMPACFDNLIEKANKASVKGLATAHTMAHNNIKEICYDSVGKYEKVFDFDSIFGQLLTDITKYGIKRIWAYNCTFDKSALERLFNEQQFTILSSLVAFCDIIPAILYTRLLCPEYIEFCKTNGFVTEKGNIQTKAEIVYRYLTGDMEYVEEHTGLADVKDEFFILRKAMETTKSVKRTPCQAWKVIKQFCEVEGIYIPALDNC